MKHAYLSLASTAHLITLLSAAHICLVGVTVDAVIAFLKAADVDNDDNDDNDDDDAQCTLVKTFLRFLTGNCIRCRQAVVVFVVVVVIVSSSLHRLRRRRRRLQTTPTYPLSGGN